LKKKYILANEIDPNELWLLEEGHCMRSQVINLCALKELEKEQHQLEFAAGSIETLKKIIELNKGITILPKLALKDMSEKQKSNVRYFKSPAPVREIGIVTYRNHVKEPLINALKIEILSNIPKDMMVDKDRKPTKI
jgi:LysR family hydrogen peroxide-inducible transcriptional activator